MNKKFENKHLEPIFNIVLPAIEKFGMNYWIYGGVAIAGVKGYFYRFNKDIDIFVLEKDYKKAIGIIKAISDKNLWKFEPAKLREDRLKSELFINGKEILSIVPVYERGNEVEFIFESGSKKIAREFLKSVIRSLGAYKFITPSEDFLKVLLRYYLECFLKSERKRNDKNLWEKRKQDAEKLLGYEETKEFFPETIKL